MRSAPTGDEFGDPDPARATAATKAMLGMRKIVIAELEDAVRNAQPVLNSSDG